MRAVTLRFAALAFVAACAVFLPRDARSASPASVARTLAAPLDAEGLRVHGAYRLPERSYVDFYGVRPTGRFLAFGVVQADPDTSDGPLTTQIVVLDHTGTVVLQLRAVELEHASLTPIAGRGGRLIVRESRPAPDEACVENTTRRVSGAPARRGAARRARAGHDG